jgi:hypothetical protein
MPQCDERGDLALTVKEPSIMKRYLAILVAVGGLFVMPFDVQAHCDAIDGPVATAALKALDTKNVNLILPYAPATAEAEMTAAFQQAVVVRAKGAEAKALADRYFMETAVRLHRAGEKAPYTGLKPARTDFGPAIPAAEKALESGSAEAVMAFFTHEIEHSIGARFAKAVGMKALTKEPTTSAGVPAARQRVIAELDFITFVEHMYEAARANGHAE